MLYEGVRGLGGYKRVNETRSWKALKNVMHVQPCVNSFGTQLRRRYERIVAPRLSALYPLVDDIYKDKNLHDDSWSFLEARGCMLESPDAPRAAPVIDPRDAPSDKLKAADGKEHPEATRAAIQARMSPFFLSEEEQSHRMFSRYVPSLTQLDLRLHIVRLWYRNVQKRLSVHAALKDVPTRYHGLGTMVFSYLEMSGAINFGALPLNGTAELRALLRDRYPFIPKHVAIVGAGIAGIAAARHLQMYGVKVTVLEAHESRAGGRIHTERDKFSAPVDLGAMLLSGTLQNPLAVVAKQCGAKMVPVEQHVRVFDTDGNWLDPDMHRKAAIEFRKTIEAAFAFRERQSALSPELHTMSLGTLWQKLLEYRAEHDAASQMRDMLRSAGRRAHPVVERQVALPPLDPARMAELKHERETTSRVFRWLMASIEMTQGADVNELSLMDWNCKGVNGFVGDMAVLPAGFGALFDALNVKEEIGPILFDCLVTRVTNNGGGQGGALHGKTSGVTVTIRSSFGSASCERFDAVILSVPLGVLKAGDVAFEPPLSCDKRREIEGLGVGAFVKVILEFDSQFLEDSSSFGALRESVDKRGEFFFFWNVGAPAGKHILVAVVPEPAARFVEKKEEKDTVKAVMEVLRRKYPSAPDPAKYLVTQWTNSPLSRGASSFVRPRENFHSSGAYQKIAEPVDNVIFFAGEHTLQGNPSDAASALLSGYREAWNVLSTIGMAKCVAEAYNSILHASREPE